MTINSGMMSSNTDLRSTPQDFFNKLDSEFNFNLDPCATDDNHKCENYFTKENDGLLQDWNNYNVFINPPYGRTIGKWVEKAKITEGGGKSSITSCKNRHKTVSGSYILKSRN